VGRVHEEGKGRRRVQQEGLGHAAAGGPAVTAASAGPRVRFTVKFDKFVVLFFPNHLYLFMFRDIWR
jgi:hypothetical protein